MTHERIVVVVPTIDGREEHLQRCLDAYHRTCPDALVRIERNHPSCGAAWLAGASWFDTMGVDYDFLHLTADDLEPHDGWHEAAVETVQSGRIPAPLVFHPNGQLESAGLVGFGCYNGPHADWQPVESTTVPFLTHVMWDTIGMIPIHYCTDKWVSARGAAFGWDTVIRTPMRFTHHTASAGRDYGRCGADNAEYVRRLAEAIVEDAA